MRVGLIGAVPFLAYFLAMQLNGWHSDLTQERRWHTSVPLFLGAGALLLLGLIPGSLVSLVTLFTIVGVGGSYLSTFWAIPTETLPRSAAPPAVGIINASGSIAGFAGPYTFGYAYARTGSFSLGLLLMMIAAVAAAFLVLRVPGKGWFRPDSVSSFPGKR
jgi:MFS family permease